MYLLALLVVLVTTSVAMVMANGANGRLQAENSRTARAQCRAAALGMLRAVVNDLTISTVAGTQPGLVTVAANGEMIGDCTVVLLGRDPSGRALHFGLIAEAGKMDVNAASVDALAAMPDMNTGIAAAIVDWRDVDDVPDEAGGAERSDIAYSGATVPYAPRNGAIETLDELRMVRGVDDALWFGEDVNRNGMLDAGEDVNGDGRLQAGLRAWCSLDNREPATAADGTARTSIRQANALRQRCTGLFGEERGTELGTEVQARQPFANRLHLIASLDVSDTEAALLWQSITDGNRVGLVDAWSCPDVLLSALVGDSTAQNIIAARPSVAPNGPGWLANVLGVDECARLGGLLTSGSYQFRADILAIRNDGAGWSRLEALIDCSAGIPRVISIRPFDVAGWPLPAATPQQLRRAGGDIDVATFLATGHR